MKLFNRKKTLIHIKCKSIENLTSIKDKLDYITATSDLFDDFRFIFSVDTNISGTLEVIEVSK